jgi:hypothetical protein
MSGYAPSYNPQAPLVINGLNDGSPQGFQDQSFDYTYDVVLTGNQFLRDQVVSIFTEADFAWRALIPATFTGVFSVRFTDGQGYYLSSGLIHVNNLTGTPADPWIVFPETVYPAGGRIGIDIQDLSGAGNTIQLLFRGVNRYRLR